MIDIQSEKEERGILIEKAGIKKLRYPVRIYEKNKERFQTAVAEIELAVEVPVNVKGTHMSRFTRIIHRHKDMINADCFIKMLRELKQELGAKKAYGVFSFPYYVEKSAPVSGEKSLMEYICRIDGESGVDFEDIFLSVSVPITTLCPCSKAISKMGAHNQRAEVKVRVRVIRESIWIEDIITAVEESASAPLYALLKRVDEKHVTEQAYKKPQFVEDVVREIYLRIKEICLDKSNCAFTIECESFESIHNHSAFAKTSYVC